MELGVDGAASLAVARGSLYVILALASSGCTALHHIPTPDHDLQTSIPTPVHSLSVRVLWGEPGALPPAAIDRRRRLGIGIEPTFTVRFP